MLKTNTLLALALVLQTVFAPVAAIAADAQINSNNVVIGQKTTANKSITFNVNAGAANPKLRATTSGLQFANDGVNFLGIGSGGSSGGLNINSNSNPDFEQGLTGYTPSTAGLLTLATSGSNLLRGNGSAVFTPTAAGQYIDFPSVTAPNGINGQCEFDFYYRYGLAANYTMQVYDGSSNLLATRVIDLDSPNGRDYGVPFTCAPGGTYKARLLAAASGAAIVFDTVYVGTNKMASFIDAVPANVQTFTSSATYNRGANVRWIRIKGTGSGGGGGGSACSSGTAGTGGTGTTTTVGSIISSLGGTGGTSSNNGGVGIGGTTTVTTSSTVINVNSPAGGNGGVAGYSISNAAAAHSGNGGISIYGPSGVGQTGTTSTGGGASIGGGGGGASCAQVTTQAPGHGGGAGSPFDVIVTAPASSYVITIGTGGSGGTAGTSGAAGGVGGNGEVIIEEYGYASGQAFTPATSSWFVDANVGTTTMANTTIPTTAVSTNTPVSGSNITLVQNAASSLSVGLPCLATAQSVGTTSCSGSTGTYGVTFNLPSAGRIQVCGTFTHYVQLGASSNLDTTWQMAETDGVGNILQLGNDKTNDILQTQGNTGVTLRVCGVFPEASASQKYFKLVFISTVSGTISNNYVVAARDYANRDAHFTAEPLAQNVVSPIVVGPFVQMPTGAITSSSYTALPSDSIIDVDTTSNAVTVTLASPVGFRGKTVTIAKKNSGANLAFITGTIAGASKTVALHAQNEYNEFYSDGTSWQWKSDSERTERVAFASNGTLTSESGNWATPSNVSTGNYLLSVPSGLFSAVPTCTCTFRQATALPPGSFICNQDNGTSTATAVYMNSVYPSSLSSGSTFSGQAMNVFCKGPR